jgi:hypothetical protein
LTSNACQAIALSSLFTARDCVDVPVQCHGRGDPRSDHGPHGDQTDRRSKWDGTDNLRRMSWPIAVLPLR